MMQQQYDVIIAGCGPAGAIAGTVLAKRGLSVAMLDRETFPRPKLCGGLLTWKSMQLLEKVLGENAENLTKRGAINWESSKYVIRTPEGLLADGKMGYPFYFTDRAIFDNVLLEHARNAGASVFENAPVDSVDADSGMVRLTDGREMQGRAIIGADGANSRIRRCLGPAQFDRERWNKNLAPALELTIPHEIFPREVKDPELVLGYLEAGYGWVFPNRNGVVVGICGLNPRKENFGEIFLEYLDFLGLQLSTIPDLRGHPLPYGNWLENPCKGRVLLAGDAGGFVEPLFGEGIFFAMCSGFHAAQSIADAMALDTDPAPGYRARLDGSILPEIRASNTLRWKLFQAQNKLGIGALRLFVKLGAPWLTQMVHGQRSYRFWRRKHWVF